MKTRKLTIALIAFLAIFVVSCGNNNANSHDEHADHNHATEAHTDTQNENEALVDASGETIFGCPMHKDIIGSEGDKCPKCNGMEMIPVRWSLDGIDTVRVTSLPDYNSSTK